MRIELVSKVVNVGITGHVRSLFSVRKFDALSILGNLVRAVRTPPRVAGL